MSAGETHLQMEERHVAESLGRLDRQRDLVARLEVEASETLQAARTFLVEVEAFHLLALTNLALERARIVPLPD